MRIKKNNILDYAIYLLFFLWYFFDFLFNFDLTKSILVQVSFFLIGVSSIYLYIKDNRFFSINKAVLISIFLFMSYTPFYQYLAGSTFWGLDKFNDDDYLFANILIILFMFVFFASYKIFFPHIKENKKCKKFNFSINNSMLAYLIVLSVLATFFLYYFGELTSVNNEEADAGSLYIVIINVLRYIPVSVVLIIVIGLRYKALNLKSILVKIFVVLAIINFLIVFFPTNGTISRYLLFGSYLTLFAACFKSYKHPSLLLVIVFIGFAFIFPAFNFFKYHTLNEIELFKFGGFDPTFNDYDAYYLLMNTIKYVNKKGVLFGENLVSALFCFVPRSIWPAKLKASGSIIVNYFGAAFDNVSCPLFAEFYLAFHIPGMIIGTLMFAFIIKYVEYRMNERRFGYEALYYMFLGLMLAILRGSLLPFASYSYSIIISFSICYMPIILNRTLITSKTCQRQNAL